MMNKIYFIENKRVLNFNKFDSFILRMTLTTLDLLYFKKMKNNISSILFSVAIIVASIILGNAYLNRNRVIGSISVTGLGKADFTSDLIVWECTFSNTNTQLEKAYADLEKDKKIVSDYLSSKGVPKEAIVFSAVETDQQRKNVYSANGNYMGDEFVGYVLRQSVTVESKEVEKIEKIAREITELLNQGLQLYSNPPRYYYTKLEDLKIEMVSAATENARSRAEKIATNSKSKLGDLISGKMGIFQITGQHSNEDYSWGGAFNTSSKEKTASITMKLDYNVK